ncbi:MAG: hypothetical protein IKY07_03205 [Clostridia bacterium]|nr:hypothetical protein [Clostridia bacterium]
MSFKRALWSSGLTYVTRCPNCGTSTKYTDRQLDFRAWFPNGFVYCGGCRRPLRHNEIFAVNPDGSPVYKTHEEAAMANTNGYLKSRGVQVDYNGDAGQNGSAGFQQTGGAEPGVAYCRKCGRKYRIGTDFYCSGCGEKLGEQQ